MQILHKRNLGRHAAHVLLALIAFICSPAVTAATGAETLLAKLKALRPDLPIVMVHPTPVPGIHGVELAGGTFLYGTEDGRHLFAGDLYAMEASLVNLTDGVRAVKRRDQLAKVPAADMVVFSPAKNTRQSVYVFTDVDCGYCRKLHQEMKAINDLGIEVRYLAFPRQGVGSDGYNHLVSAWCSEDPRSAITKLKAGQPIAKKTCANPVADQYELGQQLGVNGTPAIITQSGELLPGYMPAKELALALGLK